MKRKALWWASGTIAAMAIVAGCAGALAQDPPAAAAAVHFSGVINDYPESTTSGGATIGPWEVRGPWSLDLHGFSGTANFSAALTMEFSDLSVGAGAAADARHQHTHHITMTNATLIENPPASENCPPSASGTPAYNVQFEVKGMADVSGNGGSPFGAGILVPLQVCVEGGPNVQFSNITLVFTKESDGTPSPATLHFGAQPVHGVVGATN